MHRHERSSLFIAALISIAVHATASIYLGHYAALQTEHVQPDAHVLHISLAPARPATPVPEPALAPQTTPVPTPTAEPRVEPEPLPVHKPAPKSEVKQVTLPEPVIEPLPAGGKVLEYAELIEEHSAVSISTEAPLNKPAPAPAALKDERKSYLLRLLAHIDSHKFYPRSARQRGVEGEIQVAFYLLRNGGIRDLQIKGGSKVLRKAAKQALQQALSLPPPPESMQLYEKIRFTMVYRLDS